MSDHDSFPGSASGSPEPCAYCGAVGYHTIRCTRPAPSSASPPPSAPSAVSSDGDGRAERIESWRRAIALGRAQEPQYSSNIVVTADELEWLLDCAESPRSVPPERAPAESEIEKRLREIEAEQESCHWNLKRSLEQAMANAESVVPRDGETIRWLIGTVRELLPTARSAERAPRETPNAIDFENLFMRYGRCGPMCATNRNVGIRHCTCGFVEAMNRVCAAARLSPGSEPAHSGAGAVEDARLAEIEARLNAATPGPWIQTRDIKTGVKIWPSEHGSHPMFQVIGGVRYSRVTDADPVPQWQKDCDFVRCAPADIAYLLAEVRRLRSPRPAGEGAAILGYAVRTDSTVPPGEVRMEQHGQTVAKIVNVGEAPTAPGAAE